jgi:hypothetical protein
MNSKHRALNFLRLSYLLSSEGIDSETTRKKHQAMNGIVTSLESGVWADQRYSGPELHVKI